MYNIYLIQKVCIMRIGVHESVTGTAAAAVSSTAE